MTSIPDNAFWERHPKLNNWRDSPIRRRWNYSVFTWVEDRKLSSEVQLESHCGFSKTEQKRIEQQGMRYPLMKLADMYFHQIGLEIEAAKAGSSDR